MYIYADDVFYRKGKNAAEVTEEIRYVYEKVLLKGSTCRKLFSRFKASNFDLNDLPRLGRPR